MTIHQDKLDAVAAARDLCSAVATISAVLHGDPSSAARATGTPRLQDLAVALAQFAWDGQARGGNDQLSEDLHEFGTAQELLLGKFMLPDGTELFPKQFKDAIRRLAQAAETRRAIDEGGPVRIEGLAALAGVAEKTVRMAANPKSAHPLRVVKDGHWTLIDAADALAWLRRRNDFRPTCASNEDLEQPTLSDTAQLARACRHWRESQGLSTTSVQEVVGMTDAEGDAYRRMEMDALGDDAHALTPSLLYRLATTFRLPDPRGFARQAHRLVAVKAADARADAELNPKHAH